MSDTHDASNCDAFPLAVGLTQVQARYAKLEALADKLAVAITHNTNCKYGGCGTCEAWLKEALAAYNLHKIDG